MTLAFQRADPDPRVYEPVEGAGLLAALVMPLATFLVAGRLVQPPGDLPSGIYRSTAVPGSFGLLLWALLHLLNLGSVRHVLLFGGMGLIALIATIKNARLAPAGRRHVGVVPFLAVVRGRERFTPRELIRPLLLGLGLYAALLGLHPVVIGRDPLAGLW